MLREWYHACMTGSEFEKNIQGLEGAARDKAIGDMLMSASNLPAWLRGPWAPVKMGRVTIYAAPDYLSGGDDADYVRTAVTPMTAERVAGAYGAILPTRKMVNAIYAAAASKLPSITYDPASKIESTARMIEHSRAIDKGVKSPPSATNILAGHKKDVVVGPELDGSRVAIYGWQPDPKVFPHQPYSTVHDKNYVDYSHGVRLVSRSALLDDQPIDLMDVFRDPKLVTEVSDQGQFVPVFPNKGVDFPPAQVSSGVKTAGFIVAGAVLGGSMGGPVGALLGGIAGAIVPK